ncbi:hypothetical protein BN1708_001237 [Verticillium longisporum]|uniref:Uncharacterized protein n=1 Tax=Verticillium longisporum TaxID=100787 RepID=A0A0G4MMY6_VERLO|nr:hypothetical protein BN1708_001237 [Verticillium longisporum]
MAPSSKTNFKTYEAQARLVRAMIAAHPEVKWNYKACCDSLLGIQYVMYGDNSAAPVVVKEHPLEDFQPGTYKPPVLEINGRPTQA